MADYFPLLAKAVAGLPNSTLEARRAIYERARKALFGQLRMLEPPVPESVIEREAQDLEAAVARLEAEIASQLEPGVAVESGEVPAAPAPPPIDEPIGLPPGSEPASRLEAPDIAAVPESAGRGAEATFEAEIPTADEAADQDAHGDGHAKKDFDSDEFEAERPSAAGAIQGTSGPRPDQPAARSRSEARRPVAPRPAPAAAPPKRLWIVGATVGLVVTLVAVAAYLLRDRPEDLLAAKTAMQANAPDPGTGGKIVDRIGSGETAIVAPPVVSKKVETVKSRVEPINPSVAVARRAALLIEAPEEKAKVKTFLGTVVWRLDNVSNGPGEPLSMAVRADIDIPEEKMQAAMTFQKNLDATLPASHTIKLRFVIQPGGSLGGVKQISVPQMRGEDIATGEALNGVPVPVMENSFLVGLARGPAEAANLDLMRSREWLDVPMLLANGRIAKLTFEKGTSGQSALEDALASWQGQ